MTALLLWAGVVLAGAPKLYVNGERADGLREVVLEEVDVRIDDKGNIWITAPQYVVGNGGETSASDAVAPQSWWLVPQDLSSSGQSLEVYVHGRRVAVVASGSAKPVDLSLHLRRGANPVVVKAPPRPGAAGGPLSITIGPGALGDDGVSLDTVAVSVALDAASADHSLERSFVVRLP